MKWCYATLPFHSSKCKLFKMKTWKVFLLFFPFSFSSHPPSSPPPSIHSFPKYTDFFFHKKVIAIDIYIQSLRVRLKIARLAHTHQTHHVLKSVQELGFPLSSPSRDTSSLTRIWEKEKMMKKILKNLKNGKRRRKEGTRMKKAILSTFQ